MAACVVLLIGLIVLITSRALRLIHAENSRKSEFAFGPPNSTIKMRLIYNGTVTDVVQKTNKWGFLGEQPPDDWDRHFTIITVGGSTTHCLVLGYGEDWPAQLEKEMRKHAPETWVGNAGLPGHTTRGHLILMRSVISRIHPRMVIFLDGTNDLGISLQRDRKLEKKNQYPRHSFTYYKLLLRTRLMELWNSVFADPSTGQSATSVVWEFAPPPLRESRAYPVPEDQARMLPGLPEYRSNIRRLASMARSMNIQPVFMTQPTLFEDTAYWRRLYGGSIAVDGHTGEISAALVAKLLGEYNRTLLEVCAREHIACLDLAGAIPHSSRYFFDDAHFTKAGAELVAKAVARFLLGLHDFSHHSVGRQ